MKPQHSGNVPPTPSEKLQGGSKGKSMPKGAPGGIQAPKPVDQGRKGFKCHDPR